MPLSRTTRNDAATVRDRVHGSRPTLALPRQPAWAVAGAVLPQPQAVARLRGIVSLGGIAVQPGAAEDDALPVERTAPLPLSTNVDRGGRLDDRAHLLLLRERGADDGRGTALGFRDPIEFPAGDGASLPHGPQPGRFEQAPSLAPLGRDTAAADVPPKPAPAPRNAPPSRIAARGETQ